MNKIIDELLKKKDKAKLGGGPRKIEKQHELGAYTARERIEKLVDEGSFLELGQLAHSDQEGKEEGSAGDGVVTGLAKVNGRPVAVQAADKTVFAGTEGMVYFRKTQALHNLAVRRGLPMFNLMEGGGLRMPDGMGSDGISQMLFPQELLQHHRQVPLITSILGDSFGGPTWTAVSSDFVSQVKGTAMAVAGPRMLEVATGEKVSNEELGGWEVHAEYTGQADHFSKTEDEAIDNMKRFLDYMPQNSEEAPAHRETTDDPHRKLDEVVDIVPTRTKRAYDMKKVIRLIVDEEDYFEMKAEYGKALITVLARIDGRVVGVIANQPMQFAGAAGAKECEKAADFICLCDSYHIPLVFLHDIPGFRVSSDAEKLKMPTKIMMWNQALAQSTVPKISIVIRKSVGAAYGNMCGPTMGADFVVAWPTAEINFTGPEVGINVVYGNELKNAENIEEKRSELLETWGFDSSPYKAAGKHLIDDVIDPRETRTFLSQTLEFACAKNGSMSKRWLANWPTGF
ncbi:methylmalonyl-CoA decarboxylase [Salimicrobium jeotgali]|uniref:Carboxyl transferase n=1 Tax=Salimicrobium jeotgali TaxID=1230341 RepID=K2GAI4_9BACI|nr:carboxyl transferase domain-containing protein [Salimicrobium jeotgali]AKG05356.1 methylmalonyl-CoA decarboxylase [Salimicrobium jeotgali]EKE31362.1 carboxyl transferase [Salimicrobium jeotgali]MBM7696972.1 acetyl-CoA carboxylase carboxyltransferase component [Salimicrobium jeotgali]